MAYLLFRFQYSHRLHHHKDYLGKNSQKNITNKWFYKYFYSTSKEVRKSSNASGNLSKIVSIFLSAFCYFDISLF